ncbi:SCP2 domain-containing protein [Janthinobacterium sp. PC23-8]|uniref:ubiquinone anaerobic biosynthesis accessory factor UbiT n=1 Tax=Janthinobacterium sp. PC23-8 TaxID=2012679 RepID=UPI000B96E1C8|nr:SCP2 sterol-binding domain-containing protein [Janthinobacterium sp. PC23-8]OYO27636.1 sterol-binding protein [Janthinobacterium sp. PC23-8]
MQNKIETLPPFRLPSPFAALLARLPPYPASWAFVQGLNRLLAPQLPDDVRALLQGRSLRLRVLDAGVAVDFCWQGTAFAPARHGQAPDLTIGAGVHDLLLLARRQEDPDTLFFSRRLLLEGDTELGLLFKNTLDALELPPFDVRSLHPRRVLARLCGQVEKT